MNRVSVFFLGVIVGAILLFVTERYYIVRSKESVHLIPKVSSKLEFPYRDIREYTVEDWQNDPSLGVAIVKSQKQELMAETGINGLQQQFEGLLKSLSGT